MSTATRTQRLTRIMRDLETMHLEGQAADERALLMRRFHSLLGIVAYDEATLAEAAPSAEILRGVEAFAQELDARHLAREAKAGGAA